MAMAKNPLEQFEAKKAEIRRKQAVLRAEEKQLTDDRIVEVGKVVEAAGWLWRTDAELTKALAGRALPHASPKPAEDVQAAD